MLVKPHCSAFVASPLLPGGELMKRFHGLQCMRMVGDTKTRVNERLGKGETASGFPESP